MLSSRAFKGRILTHLCISLAPQNFQHALKLRMSSARLLIESRYCRAIHPLPVHVRVCGCILFCLCTGNHIVWYCSVTTRTVIRAGTNLLGKAMFTLERRLRGDMMSLPEMNVVSLKPSNTFGTPGVSRRVAETGQDRRRAVALPFYLQQHPQLTS